MIHQLRTSRSSAVGRSSRTALTFLFALLVVIGCSDNDLGYVTGTVTLDGQPVGPGTIRFYLDDPNAEFPPVPVSKFGEDGLYELKLSGSMFGAPPGEYTVVITDKAAELGMGDTPIIPAAYQNRKKTDLHTTVKPGQQVIDFDLKSGSNDRPPKK